MHDVWIKKIAPNHRGAPRVYLDGLQAVRAGFAPGDKFEVDVEGQKVVIKRCRDGTRTVSAKTKADGSQTPVVDINSKDLLAIFDGMDAVRVIVAKDRVYLLPLASEIKKVERFDRLMHKVAAGEPLAMGSLSHGGGILSHAIHQGLKDGGMSASLDFVNEIRDDLVLHALEHNDAWSAKTAVACMPMQEFVQDDWAMSSLPKLEILEMGLPCSGASRAGISKRSLDVMEAHPEVGHLVFSALVILNKTQPAVVLLENVPLYATSASSHILRHQLRDMGYTCHEAILEGRDHGSLENRVRWCMVATTQGVDFTFDRLAPAVRVVREVGEILDPEIGPDHPMWKGYEYLKVKAARDKEDGKGFKNQSFTASSTSIPTIRKGYHKVGTTDPLLEHPTTPGLLRKLTAREIARVKGNPERLIEGLSETVAIELMGQGVVYEPFRAVGERICDHVRIAVERGRRALRDGPQAEGSGVEAHIGSETATRRHRMTG